MAKVFSIFYGDKDDNNAKIVKTLLNAPAANVPRSKSAPKRPNSAHSAGSRMRAKAGKQVHIVQAHPSENEQFNHISRDDLISEVHELKRKIRGLEESNSSLKSESHRLEVESLKQQRRIDQLLNLSEGAKNAGNSADIRREVEKSILVRQLKVQINSLRSTVSEKDVEIETLKRSLRATYISEVENEKEELYVECRRLQGIVNELKDELHREKQRREWNSKLVGVDGGPGEELRKEVARLASGYQSILSNMSTKNPVRPSSSNSHTQRAHKKDEEKGKRPQSATQNRPVAYKDSNPQPPATKRDDDPIDHFGMEPEQLAPALVTPATTFVELNSTAMSTPFHSMSQSQKMAFQTPSVPDSPDIFQYSQDVTTPIDSGKVAQPAKKPQSLASTMNSFQATFKVGDKVQGLFRNGSTWYDATVKSVIGHELYHVVYADGDEEKGIPSSRLRYPAAPASKAPSSAASEVASGNASAAQSADPSQKSSLKSKFKVGEKVESLYYSGSTWYPATVKAVVPLDGSGAVFAYDVLYDDGDREKKVAEQNIRLPAKKEERSPKLVAAVAAVVAKKDAAGSPKLAAVVSTAVAAKKPEPVPEAPSRPKEDIVPTTPVAPAVVLEQRPAVADEFNDILEEDMEPALEALAEPVTAHQPQPPSDPLPATSTEPIVETAKKAEPLFKVGDQVEALYEGGNRWYVGTITSQSALSDTQFVYDMLYEDGDKERSVQESLIRNKSTSKLPPNMPREQLLVKFKEGDEVQGYFHEYDQWFNGVIGAVHADGTYFVKYEDGDQEKAVEAGRLRFRAPAQSAAKKDGDSTSDQLLSIAKFKKGDAIMGNYQSTGSWYPGTVDSLSVAGGALVYGIRYEDGDRETGVEEGNIKPAPVAAAADPSVGKAAVEVAHVIASKEKVSSPKKSEEPEGRGPVQRKTSTTLESFLNELSDDEDDTGLDGGRALDLRDSNVDYYHLRKGSGASKGEANEYEEDFDA